MAREAERLLAGTGWLPEPLRMPDVQPDDAGTALPDFLNDDEAGCDDGMAIAAE